MQPLRKLPRHDRLGVSRDRPTRLVTSRGSLRRRRQLPPGYRIAALEDYHWLHIGGLGYLPRTVDRSERSPQIVVRSNDNLTPSHRSDQ